MVSVPVAFGVYVTWQAPPESEHVAALNVPVPSVLQVTVPLGVLGVPLLVSETVALQVDPVAIATGLGVQVTVVLLVRLTATVSVPLEPRYVVSPP